MDWWWSYRMNKKGRRGLLPLPSGVCVCVCVYVVHLTLIRWINRNRWIVNNLPIFIYRGPARSQCIQRICRLFRDGGAHLFRYRHTGPAGSRLLSGTDRVEREREREGGSIHPIFLFAGGVGGRLWNHTICESYTDESSALMLLLTEKRMGRHHIVRLSFFFFTFLLIDSARSPPRFNPPTFNNARLLRTSAELFNSYARRYINPVQRIKLISPFPNWLLKLPLIVNAFCVGCLEPLTCPADYSFPLDVPDGFQHFCLAPTGLAPFVR